MKSWCITAKRNGENIPCYACVNKDNNVNIASVAVIVRFCSRPKFQCGVESSLHSSQIR